MASFLWWIAGFYWAVSGCATLLQNAPRLCWLAIILLAFNVFRVALACVIVIALCCCLLCFIAILYAVSQQEGASDADLRILQRYRFKQICGNGEKGSARAGSMIPIAPTSRDPSNKRALLHEDAQWNSAVGPNYLNCSKCAASPFTECCICLTAYEDGTELQCLPCNHHFHAVCISRWLRITPTCPLCKYNILKANITV